MTKETAEELKVEEETKLEAEALTDGETTETETEEVKDDDGETINKAKEETTSEDEVPTFGEQEESPPQEDSAVIKKFRTMKRDDSKRIKELESKLDAATGGEKVVTLGRKPTFEQFEFDETTYVAALDKWHDDKQKVEAAKGKVQAKLDDQDKKYKTKLEAYSTQSAGFDAQEFSEAEGKVKDSLSEQQQSVIVDNVKDSAAFVMALGRSPELREELAGIKDLGTFIFRVGKLSGSMKMTKRKPKTSPESKVRGTASITTGGDAKLNKLREEADKTGDVSKVMAYKRALKKAAA